MVGIKLIIVENKSKGNLNEQFEVNFKNFQIFMFKV